MSQREQAEIVASWMFTLDKLGDSIIKKTIVPVTVELSYEGVSFSLYGCSWNDMNEEESMYLLGKEPLEKLLEMTGSEDSGEFCLKFDTAFRVTGYLPQETYDTFDPDLAKEYHPFGPNLMIRESNDEHLCEGRKVIEMTVTYYPRLGSG